MNKKRQLITSFEHLLSNKLAPQNSIDAEALTLSLKKIYTIKPPTNTAYLVFAIQNNSVHIILGFPQGTILPFMDQDYNKYVNAEFSIEDYICHIVANSHIINKTLHEFLKATDCPFHGVPDYFYIPRIIHIIDESN